MAQQIFKVISEEENSSFALITLMSFSFLIWVNVNAIAAPPAPKVNDGRRTPLSEELFDSSNEWREPVEPRNKWRTDESLTRKDKKRSRFEDKRFKPKYYDPEKEGDTWDPYSSGSKPNTKPATIFRFQF